MRNNKGCSVFHQFIHSTLNLLFCTGIYRTGDTVYPLTLKGGEYFILGDQRENAKDSRYFGAVKGKEIKGRVITVLFAAQHSLDLLLSNAKKYRNNYIKS